MAGETWKRDWRNLSPLGVGLPVCGEGRGGESSWAVLTYRKPLPGLWGSTPGGFQAKAGQPLVRGPLRSWARGPRVPANPRILQFPPPLLLQAPLLTGSFPSLGIPSPPPNRPRGCSLSGALEMRGQLCPVWAMSCWGGVPCPSSAPFSRDFAPRTPSSSPAGQPKSFGAEAAPPAQRTAHRWRGRGPTSLPGPGPRGTGLSRQASLACVKRLGLQGCLLPACRGPGWLGTMDVTVQAPQSLSEGFWPSTSGPPCFASGPVAGGVGSSFGPWGSGGGPSASFRLLAGCPLAWDPVSLPKGSLELGGWSAGPAPLLLDTLSKAGLAGFPLPVKGPPGSPPRPAGLAWQP